MLTYTFIKYGSIDIVYTVYTYLYINRQYYTAQHIVNEKMYLIKAFHFVGKTKLNDEQKKKTLK